MKDINNFIYERLTINNINDGDKFEVKCRKTYKDLGFTQRRTYNGICKIDNSDMKKMFIKNDDGKDIEFFSGIRFNGTFDIIKILN